jgi:hypothetical protein
MADRNRDFPSSRHQTVVDSTELTESDAQVYLIVLAAKILTTAILKGGDGPSFLIALGEPYPQDPNYAQTCKTYQFPALYVAPRLAFGNQKIMTAKGERICESGTGFSVTSL